MTLCNFPLFLGRLKLVLRREQGTMFSEYYRLVPMLRVGPVCLVWRRYR